MMMIENVAANDTLITIISQYFKKDLNDMYFNINGANGMSKIAYSVQSHMYM